MSQYTIQLHKLAKIDTTSRIAVSIEGPGIKEDAKVDGHNSFSMVVSDDFFRKSEKQMLSDKVFMMNVGKKMGELFQKNQDQEVPESQCNGILNLGDPYESIGYHHRNPVLIFGDTARYQEEGALWENYRVVQGPDGYLVWSLIHFDLPKKKERRRANLREKPLRFCDSLFLCRE